MASCPVLSHILRFPYEEPPDDLAPAMGASDHAAVGDAARAGVATDAVIGARPDDNLGVSAGRDDSAVVARPDPARVGGVAPVDALSSASQVDIQLDGGGATA